MPKISRRDMLRWLLAASAAPRIPAFADQADYIPPIIMDAHIDLGWNIINFERDYTRSVEAIRADEAGTYSELLSGEATLGLPEWQAGRVALIFGVIFVIPERLESVNFTASYATLEQANQQGIRQLEAIQAFVDSSDSIEIVTSADDLTRSVESWENGATGKMGILLAMEGADPIQSLDDLHWWYEQGLRSIGLSWGRTQYAGSSSESIRLTDAGRELLREMQSLNMLLDLAHISETSFWGALNIWEGATAYTHGNARHFLGNQRALSDEQIRALVEHDGVMGIGCYNGFFERNLAVPPSVTLQDVANAIDYVCQLVGDCEHVAIGSDLDGGFGLAHTPQGINTVADLQQIFTILHTRGYTSENINRIAYENWHNLLLTVL